MTHRLLVLVLVALASAVGLLSPAGAGAHAAFLKASPGPGQRVEVAPGQLLLRFTEPLNARLTTVRLEGPRGRSEASVAIAGSTLTVTPVEELRDGGWVARWRTVSTEDGHPLEGRFSFGVRADPLAAGAVVESSPLRSGGWLRIVVRAMLYVALLGFAGALLMRVLLPDRDRRPWLAPAALDRSLGPGPGEEAARRLAVLTGWLGVSALGGALIVAVVDAVVASGRLSAGAVADYLLAGSAGVARIATVVLVGAAVLLASSSRRAAAGAVVLAVGAVAMSGHAGSAQPRVAAIVNDWAHLLAGAVWLGGIALLVYTWRAVLRDRTARAAVTRHVLPVFGRVALPAFVIVVVSGTVSALIELGAPRELWQTAYGRVLAVKVALVALIAAASYVHALRLRPRLLRGVECDERIERRQWQLLRVQAPAGIAVVAAAALLVSFPLPPRQAADAAVAATGVACDPCPLPTPRSGELAVAAQAGRGVLAAWIRRTPGGLEGELRQTALSGKPSDAPLRLPGGGRLQSCGSGCRRFKTHAAPVLVVERRDAGVWRRAVLPARWNPDGAARARALLERTQLVMRALRFVRERERVTSGPGTLATSTYQLQAPDRLYADSGVVERIDIGARSWLRGEREAAWQRSERSVPFSLRTWFRWTPFAQAIWLLGSKREDGRRVAQIALFDPGTPSWQRLQIDLRSGRALRGEIVSRAHYITQRFDRYQRPVRITAPRDVRG